MNYKSKLELSSNPFKRSIAGCVFLLWTFISTFAQPQLNDHCVLSNLNEFNKDSIIKVNHLVRRLVAEKSISSLKCAKTLSRQIISIAPLKEYKKGKAIHLDLIGEAFQYEEKYDSALHYYQLARDYRLKENIDPLGVAHYYQYVGLTYSDMGQYDQAIEAHLEGLKSFEKLRDTLALASEYLHLGNNTQKLINQKARIFEEEDLAEDFEKGIRYYHQAIRFFDLKNRLSQKLATYREISWLFLESNELDSAEYYIDRILSTCNAIIDTAKNNKTLARFEYLKARGLERKGSFYEKQKLFDPAISHFRDALHLFDSLGYTSKIWVVNTNIGNCFEEQEKYIEALPYYEKAYEESLKKGMKLEQDQIQLINKNLADTYLVLDKKEKALPFLIESHKNAQETATRELSENVGLVERLADARASIEVSESQKLLSLISLAGSVLLLLTLGITFYQRSRLHKSEQKQMTLEVEKKNLEIKQQETQFAKKIDGLIEESSKKLLEERVKTQEIALRDLGRELHDNVGGLLSACKREAENITSSEANSGLEKTIGLIQKAIDETRGLSHNLKALNLKNGLVPALKEFIRELNEIPDAPEFKLETFMMKGLELPAKWELNIYRIFQEASTNILKYAAAEKVDIQLIYSNDENLLNITIEDDGKGFDQLAEKSGIGLENMHDRAGEMGGKLTISSSKGNGTALFIEIPFEQQTS